MRKCLKLSDHLFFLGVCRKTNFDDMGRYQKLPTKFFSRFVTKLFFLFRCFDLLVINPEIIFYLLSDTIRQKMSDCFVFPSSPPHYLCDTITHRISSDLPRHPHFFQRLIQRFRRWTHLTFLDLCDHNDHDDQ